jgi:hypothetical protein
MIEPLFGSGSSVWTGMPSTVFGFQPPAVPSTPFGFQSPITILNRPMAAPLGSSTLPGIPGGITGAQAASIPVAFPFASQPAAFFGPAGADPTPGMTAPSLIAAVAMRRGQPNGPTNDPEVEDFIYDAFELLPGTADVDVRCEGGRVTLTGSVHHKRLKRDVGEIAWAIPVLHDVQNNVTITSRRRTRAASRDAEVPATSVNRKQG